jgi:hypothetical protein
VFVLAPDGTETVLHAFTGHPDGEHPYDGLTADNAGNIFGTTFQGGDRCKSGSDPDGCGTVFELTK